MHSLELGIAVMVFAIAATLVLVGIQTYVIRRTRSVAIMADSVHYKADVLANTTVILALLASQQGWTIVDPLLALAVAGYILYSAWSVGRLALNDLLDRELPQAQRDEILAAARQHPEVLGAHDLRTRVSGRTVYIQLHLELNDLLPLIESHRSADEG